MMNIKARLIECFQAVFPELSEEEIPRASLTSVADWDSVASINLIVVIEEEFGAPIPPEDVENLISFELILDHLRRAKGVA